MDYLDQYGIQLFADSSDEDETFLVSRPTTAKTRAAYDTAMRKPNLSRLVISNLCNQFFEPLFVSN